MIFYNLHVIQIYRSVVQRNLTVGSVNSITCISVLTYGIVCMQSSPPKNHLLRATSPPLMAENRLTCCMC